MSNLLEHVSNKDLIKELERRLALLKQSDPDQLALRFEIGPYWVITKMIEKGWKEDPRLGKSDPRINMLWDYLGYDGQFTDDESYCAATLNACLKVTGFKTSDAIPASRSFAKYGSHVSFREAKKGDIVVFERKGSSWRGHVGFVHSINYTTGDLLVAGGNQTNMMCVKHYQFESKTLKVLCFRRITDKQNVSDIDYGTLKKWKLL